jgi:hypothetical protein
VAILVLSAMDAQTLHADAGQAPARAAQQVHRPTRCPMNSPRPLRSSAKRSASNSTAALLPTTSHHEGGPDTGESSAVPWTRGYHGEMSPAAATLPKRSSKADDSGSSSPAGLLSPTKGFTGRGDHARPSRRAPALVPGPSRRFVVADRTRSFRLPAGLARTRHPGWPAVRGHIRGAPPGTTQAGRASSRRRDAEVGKPPPELAPAGVGVGSCSRSAARSLPFRDGKWFRSFEKPSLIVVGLVPQAGSVTVCTTLCTTILRGAAMSSSAIPIEALTVRLPQLIGRHSDA